MNNKLIAEFMDVPCDKDLYTPLCPHTGETLFIPSSQMKYDTSWDWLMAVVEKIEAELEEEFRVVTLEHECSIYQKTQDHELQDAFQCVAQKFGTSRMGATYNAVVEFIEWYNKYICGSCGDHVNEVVFNEDTDVDECKNCTL